jgi:hypothetical protein
VLNQNATRRVLATHPKSVEERVSSPELSRALSAYILNRGCSGYISIYQDTTFPAVNDSVITDYNYVGCYSEGVGGRALEYQQDLNTSTITIEECLFACKAGGFAFAGVEYASQCFCNVVLGNGSVPLPASSCSTFPMIGSLDNY